MEQWLNGWGTGLPIQRFWVQNTRVAPRSTQSLILLRLIKWVPGTCEDLLVEKTLSPCSSYTALRQVDTFTSEIHLTSILKCTSKVQLKCNQSLYQVFSLILPTECTWKIKKNVFYFTKKAMIILEILKFLHYPILSPVHHF